jgi:hypothetical protein
MRRISICAFALSAFVLCHASLLDAAESKPVAPGASNKVSFARDVAPLFAKHCNRCHGPKSQESDYRLDIKANAFRGGDFEVPPIVPGKSAASPLIRYVSGTDEDEIVMPPEDEGKPLSGVEIATLRAWIDQGAVWPDALAGGERAVRATDHWSFQPVKHVDPPKSVDPWVANPIDAFLLAKLKAAGLVPAKPADRVTLIRRLYLDMHGLLPPPQRVRAFVDDQRPDAYARLVDEVLASPRYGERWAQHWLDVVRYADTHGFEVNTPRPDAWPYRDYVIRSLNDDKPYDQFIREQLAGDQLGVDAATGFLVSAPVLLPGQIGKDKDSMLAARQDQLDEMIQGTGAAMLGLTVGCARCHNHKFDPITQKDYYSLQAVFDGVRFGSRPLRTLKNDEHQEQFQALEKEIARVKKKVAALGRRAPVNAVLNDEKFEPAFARYVRFFVEDTNNREPCIDELEVYTVGQKGKPASNAALASTGARASSSGNYVDPLHHKLANNNDGKYGNGRSWISSEVGGGWVQIELPATVQINRVVWGRDRNKVYADRLATSYRIEIATVPNQWTTVASSQTRLPFGSQEKPSADGKPVFSRGAMQLVEQLSKLQAEKKALQPKANQTVYAGIFMPPGKTFRLLRGDHKQPREQLAPDTISILGSLALKIDTPDAERRKALADWIARADNPLTARVAVNRIWHHHFGRGIVGTPSDFGKLGEKPSHPALLDWLAGEFVRGKWSVKNLHRLILLSSAYRQMSVHRQPRAREIDADNRLLWRFPSRRVEAEPLRDTVLQVSGSLNLKAGGPGFQLFKPRVGLDSSSLVLS